MHEFESSVGTAVEPAFQEELPLLDTQILFQREEPRTSYSAMEMQGFGVVHANPTKEEREAAEKNWKDIQADLAAAKAPKEPPRGSFWDNFKLDFRPSGNLKKDYGIDPDAK